MDDDGVSPGKVKDAYQRGFFQVQLLEHTVIQRNRKNRTKTQTEPNQTKAMYVLSQGGLRQLLPMEDDFFYLSLSILLFCRRHERREG